MSNLDTLPTAEALANKFGDVIREWLTAEELAEAVRLNKEEKSADVCHTHDYCDANMAMDEAFVRCNYELFVVESGMSEAETDVFNEAWRIAKARSFKSRLPFDPSGLPEAAKARAVEKAAQSWCYATPDGRGFFVTEQVARKMQRTGGGDVYPPEAK